MDIVAERFKARYLELEGKPREALALYRSIITEAAKEPPTEQLLPVFVQASALTIKLGDAPGGIALLVEAAEHFADHGVLRPVIELCQRLPKLDPALAGQQVRFARHMLERGHVAAARQLLTDLATRRRKTTLRKTLERMASWPDDVVRTQLVDFLDRVEGRRDSAAVEAHDHDPAPEAAPPAPPAAAAPSAAATERRAPQPPLSPPVPRAVADAPAAAAPPPAPVAEPGSPRSTGPRERRPAPEPVAWPAKEVEWIAPPEAAPEPEPAPPRPRVSGPTSQRVMVVPSRHRKHRSRVLVTLGVVTGAVALVGGGVALGSRFARPEGRSETVTPPQTVASRPAPADTAVPRQEPGDSAVVPPPPADTVPARATASTAAPSRAPARPGTPPPAVTQPPTTTSPRAASTAAPTTPPAPARDTATVAGPNALPAAAAPPAHPGLTVDYTVVIVDGLTVTSVTRQGEGTTQRIVVRQALASGDTLELGVTNLGPAAATAGGGRVLVRPNPSGGSIGTARLGAFLVTARAPIAPGELEPLLKRLIEVKPDQP